MWKLIKAEFNYNKILYIILFGILIFFFLVNFIWEGREQILAIIIFFLTFTSADRYNTSLIRFRSGLPISVRKLGIIRYAGLVILWFLWAIMLFLSSLISHQGQIGMDYICWILTKIGSIFFSFGCLNLSLNISYCMKSTRHASPLLVITSFLALSGALIGVLIFFTSYPAPNITPNGILSTFPASFGLFLIGLVMIVLDIYVFGLRKSYLEKLS